MVKQNQTCKNTYFSNSKGITLLKISIMMNAECFLKGMQYYTCSNKVENSGLDNNVTSMLTYCSQR